MTGIAPFLCQSRLLIKVYAPDLPHNDTMMRGTWEVDISIAIRSTNSSRIQNLKHGSCPASPPLYDVTNIDDSKRQPRCPACRGHQVFHGIQVHIHNITCDFAKDTKSIYLFSSPQPASLRINQVPIALLLVTSLGVLLLLLGLFCLALVELSDDLRGTRYVRTLYGLNRWRSSLPSG